MTMPPQGPNPGYPQQGYPQQQQQGYQQGPYPQPGMQPGYPTMVGGRPVSSAGKRFGGYLLEALLIFVTLLIGWIIWSLIAWGNGQTPAKSLLGMRVVKTDTGRVATWGDMALRELVGKWLLGTVTLGITSLVSLFMILGSSRQGVWDKIATTIVVDES